MASLRAIFLIFAILLAGIVVAGLWESSYAAPQETFAPPSVPSELPEPRSANSTHAAAMLRFVGAGSCAARACHGNPDSSAGSAISTAYSVWMHQDPHARAYSVLFTDESRRIAEALRPNSSQPVRAWEEQRCLACHSLHVRDDELKSVPAAVLADGVSCEACHGPAEKWLSAHYMAGWSASGANRFQHSTGMQDTEHAASRAAICAGCHVGEPSRDGLPARDVNHDLIAAGHPRLTFEYAAYMAKLPRHWRDPQRTGLSSEFDEARLWLIGQTTAAQNRLALLEARASSLPSDVGSDKPTPSPWPELSEYDCFACHHTINSSNWRRRISQDPVESGPRPALGMPAWDLWHFWGVRWLAASDSTLQTPQRNSAIQSLDRVAELMQSPASDRNQIAPAARQCAEQLAILRDTTIAQSADNRLSQHLLNCISRYYANREPESWDEMAQKYLALVAINNTRKTSADASGAKHTSQVDDLLRAIRERLRFAPASDASHQSKQPSSAVFRILRPGTHSPEGFAPDASLSEMFDRVIQLLQQE